MGCAHSTESVEVPTLSVRSPLCSGLKADCGIGERHVCAEPELAEAYLELEVGKSDVSEGAVVDEHPSDLVRKHIAKCVVRALKRHGINGDADQFTPFPVLAKEIAGSCARCRSWADEVTRAQAQCALPDTLSASRKSSRSDASTYWTVDICSSDSDCTVPGTPLVDGEQDASMAIKGKWPTLTPHLIEKLQHSFNY